MEPREHLKQLAALFDRDHERLLLVLDDVAYLSRKGSYAPAAKVFGELRRHLEHHLAAEERSVDALAASGHCPDALAQRFASAHAQLKVLVEQTWSALTHHDALEVGRALDSLTRAITAHERDEKDELLPALCACFGAPGAVERAVHAALGD